MTYRFPVFVLVLAIGFFATTWGLTGASYRVYDKPDPRDAGPELNEKTRRVHYSELAFTDLVSKQRIETDEWSHLLDTQNEAPCFS
jgi:hypothetical protein